MTVPASAHEEIEQLKGTFLASLNHEIRTPLAGIMGMADLLLESSLDEEQREYVNAARLCAENLFEILNATLEYTALEGGQFTLDDSEFSVREMLDAAIAQHLSKAQAKNLPVYLTLDPTLPETMLGDAPRVRELLGHLIANAIKFTPAGKVEVRVRPQAIVAQAGGKGPEQTLNPAAATGSVVPSEALTDTGPERPPLSSQNRSGPAATGSVVPSEALTDTGPERPSLSSQNRSGPAATGSVVPSEQWKNWLVMEVCDTGIGIAPAQLDDIFQSFQQGQRGLSRSYPGLGLGLALARKLASVMGGTITAESQQGVGSTFVVRLPLRRASVDRGTRNAIAPTAAGPLLLAIDDNPVGLTVLRHVLQRHGMRVDCAASGREALDAAARRAYDLVLMDLQMPGMDGLTTAVEMRKVPGYERVPILALTANFSDDVREQCLAHGMQAYLSKPVEASELMAAVTRHIKR